MLHPRMMHGKSRYNYKKCLFARTENINKTFALTHPMLVNN